MVWGARVIGFHRRRSSGGEDPRLTAVRRALAAALDSAGEEIRRLEHRLEQEHDWLAALLGNEDGTRFTREAAQERLIVQAETAMRRSSEKLSQAKALKETFAATIMFLESREACLRQPSTRALDRDVPQRSQLDGIDLSPRNAW